MNNTGSIVSVINYTEIHIQTNQVLKTNDIGRIALYNSNIFSNVTGVRVPLTGLARYEKFSPCFPCFTIL